MPNRRSTKKSLRSSNQKKLHNLSWTRRYKTSIKDIKNSISLKEEAPITVAKLSSLQKVLDKAVKEKVIHKNKANRLKSIYARKATVQPKKQAKVKA